MLWPKLAATSGSKMGGERSNLKRYGIAGQSCAAHALGGVQIRKVTVPATFYRFGAVERALRIGSQYFQVRYCAFHGRAETVTERLSQERALVSIRLLQALLAAVLLSGCTFFFDVQDSAQPDPEPDSRQQRIIFEHIQRITQSMKDIGPSEVSTVGPNEAQSGPEKWTVCLRSTLSGSVRYFTFFVKGETIVSWRPAVINDRCETRSFSRLAEVR